MKHFFNLALRVLRLSLVGPVALVVAAVLRLVSFCRPLAVGTLRSSRIGHFAANTELTRLEQFEAVRRGQRKCTYVWFANRPISNRALLRMWRRHLKVLPTWLGPSTAFIFIRVLGGAQIPRTVSSDRDVNGLMLRHRAVLEFSCSELKQIRRELEAIELSPGDKWVCLMVRDSAYLRSQISRPQRDHHAYRDSTIENFKQAAEWLGDQGLKVIRMGALVRGPLNSAHPNVLDYALSGRRSELMDIYLASRCHFAISTGLGIDSVSITSRRPVLFVDLAPYSDVVTYGRMSVNAPKRLVDSNSGALVSLSEAIDRGVYGCHDAAQFDRLGVRFDNSTPSEIYLFVKEMLARVQGTFRPSHEDAALLRRYIHRFTTDPSVRLVSGRPQHGQITGLVSTEFLRLYPRWLD